MRRGLVQALYVLVCLIWGSTWLVIKIGLEGVPPFLGACLRFSLAATILFSLVAARGRGAGIDRDGRKAVLSCGVLSFTFSYAGVYWAEQYVSSGVTAVLYCLMPLLVALLSRFWTRSETLSARKLAGIAAGMAGTIVLFWPTGALSGMQRAGMAVALASVCISAFNLVVVKKYAKDTDVFALNAWAMAIGALGLLTLHALFERGAPVSWTPANAAAVVYLALIGSVTAFLSYFHLIKVMEATKLSLITLIFPIVAVILGRVFLGEVTLPRMWAGMATILGGVALALTGANC